MSKVHVKKDDNVVVLSGKDKGKKGKILQVLPGKNKVLIDGINIRNIQKRQLRSLIGIIPQEPFLFSGNIEDNIRLGNLKINSEQVQRAAIYVGADEFISQLPDGYKENVQELGSRLSTGQKQLISFARASVFNPQIIIFDEATANVDAETLTNIRDSLKRIKGERTSIIIAHHLSTVTDADKIVVLHKCLQCEQIARLQLHRRYRCNVIGTQNEVWIAGR